MPATRRAELLPPAPRAELRAKPGDVLIVGAKGTRIPRTGTIVAVLGTDGSPPYRVRWLAGEYESLIVPGPSAQVESHR